MPVVAVSLKRLSQCARGKFSEPEILNSLPYIGLDIESHEGDIVNLEYSPNRPDFSSEAGIARSLVGYLGVEKGLKKYDFKQGSLRVQIGGDEILHVRPFIFALEAYLSVSDDTLKQIITMQEDLHNGLGRLRSKLAIGFHNAAVLTPPLRYYAIVEANFAFVPLGDSLPRKISEILSSTDQGRHYGGLVSSGPFPMLVDSKENVLSMPPVINGELTRLEPGADHVFVDVTGTDRNAGDAAIAIVGAALADMGGEVRTVAVERGNKITYTPDMSPRRMNFDLDLVNRTLGLKLSTEQAREAAERSRLDLWSQTQASVPRYRTDIIHPVDLAEEVVLGYGISNLTPKRIRSSLVGSFNSSISELDRMIEAMVGLGLTEVFNFSLISEAEASLSSDKGSVLRVEETKSRSHEFLRSELVPSLLSVLGQSTHEEYPQRIFEQATVIRFSKQSATKVEEQQHIAGAIAGAGSNYSRIKSILVAFWRLALTDAEKLRVQPNESGDSIYLRGRSAAVFLDCHEAQSPVGSVGEISPEVLEKLGLKVPVSAFEFNLEPWL